MHKHQEYSSAIYLAKQDETYADIMEYKRLQLSIRMNLERQGAIMVRVILGTLTDDEYKNMKAAYMIDNPHIKPATGEFDKGVTVSFNSAASREDIWYDI